jgi:hypothetical protein
MTMSTSPEYRVALVRAAIRRFNQHPPPAALELETLEEDGAEVVARVRVAERPVGLRFKFDDSHLTEVEKALV